MTATAGLTCPQCTTGTLIPADAPTTPCTSCDHRAATVFVRDALALDQWLATTTARRAWLGDRIAAGDPAPAPTTAPAAAPSPTVGERPAGNGTRSVLYALGGTFVGLAGLFFLAVTWSLLAPAARVALAMAVSLGLVAAGEWTARRLPGLAETLTTVGFLSAIATLIAAPPMLSNGPLLFGMSLTGWAATVLSAATAAGVLGARLSTLRAWGSVTPVVAATGGALFALLAFEHSTGALAPTVTCAVLAVLMVDLRRQPRIHQTLPLVGAAVFALMVPLGVLAAFTERDYLVAAFLVTVAIALAVTYGVALRLTPRPETYKAALAALPVPILLALAALNDPGMVGIVGSAFTVLPALVASRRGARGLTALAASAASAVTIVAVLGREEAPGWMYVFTLAVTSTALLVAAMNAPDRSPAWRIMPLVAAVSAPAAYLTWLHTNAADAAILQAPLAVEIHTLPAGVLVAAAAAVWAFRTRRDTGRVVRTETWLTLPVLVALLPGAVWGLREAMSTFLTAEPTAARATAYLAAGILVIAAGVALRVGGLVYGGIVTTVIAALGVLVAVATLVPGWVTIGLAGCALLAVGAQWENVATRGRRATQWVGAMR